MKFLRYLFIVIFLTLVLLIPSSSGHLTSSIADELKGRFLLRVEQMDEAWYADPTTGKLHYLGRPDDALQLMQELGLGISNQNLNKLKGEGAHSSQVDAELAEKLSGRILLQTEENNQAWYVWPDNTQRYFIGRAEDAQRVFSDLGVGISEEEFKTLQLSDKYYQSLETLDLAVAAVQSEISGQSNRAVQTAYEESQITKLHSDGVTVIRFELTSPVSSDAYGYLGRGLHYWRVNGDLMNREEYLRSSEYRLLEARSDAEAILDEMLEMQTSLGFYYTDINGYPLSQEQGDTIGIPGRMILTNPNGFFGTLRDPVVYHEIDLRPDILDLRYFSNGVTYALLFRLPADTEFHSAGLYTLTPSGLVKGRDLSGLNPEECSDEFVPVCGADGVTYTNECHARTEGIEISSQGPCPAAG